MPSTSNTVSVSSGTALTSSTVIPYIRASEMEYFAQNLRPYRKSYFFFDDVNVNRFVQTSSMLDISSSNNALDFIPGDGIYCPATGGYATVIGMSPKPNVAIADNGGTIYLNENFISVNTKVVFLGGLPAATQYQFGDIVYQITESSANSSISDPNVSLKFIGTPGNRVARTLSTNTAIIGSGAVPVANTFVGKVQYWDSANSLLVISPISGTLTTNTTANVVTAIFNANNNYQYNAEQILPISGTNKFTNNTVIFNTSQNFNSLTNTTSCYVHNSGIVATPNTSIGGSNSIIVQANVSNTVIGNTLFLTSGSGIGQDLLIVNVSSSGETIYFNTPLSPYVSGNTTYTIGDLPAVDENGVLCGIFQIPNTPTVKFLTGNRVFTITDTPIVNDTNSTMKATSNYLAQGFMQSFDSVRSTPTVSQSTTAPGSTTTSINSILTQDTNPQSLVDTSSTPLSNNVIDYSTQPATSPQIQPIAQTFKTPPPKSLKQNYGIFLSSVYVWFNAKPEGLSPKFPVVVQIVKTKSGVPDMTMVVAKSIVQCENIKVSDTPDSIISSTNSTATKFKFPDPVYLLPSTEYAVVVSSQSPDYEVYISNVGGVDITSGSIKSKVSSAPYVGSFFKSQNASVWTPIQNQNLMFVLNKAVFETYTPVTVNYAIDQLPTMKFMDFITLSSSDLVLPSTALNYKINSSLFNAASNTYYLDATSTELYPSKTYSFADSLNVASGSRRRYIPAGNASSLMLHIDMQSYDRDVSPIYNQERLGAVVGTNYVNNGGINSHNITIIRDTGGHTNSANITVTISPPDLPDGIPALANVLPSQITSGNVISAINVYQQGSGYIKSPTIILDDDIPGSANSNSGGFVATVGGEDQSYGGNASARYITKMITLAPGFDAGDLRVWVNGIFPSGTNVLVYYKVMSNSDGDNFQNKKWKLMTSPKINTSPDNKTIIENFYVPSLSSAEQPTGILSYVEDGITYPIGGAFKYFAVKIVMLSSDPTIVPILTDMRAIAIPAG